MVFFLDFNSQISPKRLCSRDMAVFASLDNRSHLLSIENTPAFLDTAMIDIVCEVLAIILKQSDSLDRLALRLDSISVLADISTTWLSVGWLLWVALIHCAIIRHCAIMCLLNNC